MSNARFTPGEWKYGVRGDGSMWLSIGNPRLGAYYEGDLVCSKYDADLIIAAREMYEVLEKIARNLKDAGFTDMPEMAEAILRRARGESDE